MSPTINRLSPAALRSRYAFLFGSIAELARFHYGEKPSTRFDEIKKEVIKMHNDGYIDEFLYSNLSFLFEQYRSLLPSELANNYKKSEYQTNENLKNLGSLLDEIIGVLCGDISQIAEEQNDREISAIVSGLIGSNHFE